MVRAGSLCLLGWLVVVVGACGDRPTAVVPKPPEVRAPFVPGPTPAALAVELECRVDVAAGAMTCGAPSGRDAAAEGEVRPASGQLLVGGQNVYVTLASTNVGTSSGVLHADVTVKNLIPQALGTTDGTTLDPAGVRVFFMSITPSTVTVANADGTGTFTATNQPYFQYSQLLAQNATSSAKTWQWTLNGATTFTFRVAVAAQVRFQDGWIDLTPTSPSVLVNKTATLTATVLDVVGRVQSGATVTWGSSDPTKATVSAGVVTGVAVGSPSITASSTVGGQPVGGQTTMQVVAPVNHSYSSVGGVNMTVAAPGVLAGAAAGMSLLPADVGTRLTASGDSVKLSADGSFTYMPITVHTGSDNFTYHVVLNGVTSDAATETVNLAGKYWFVSKDSTTSSSGGTQRSPKKTIAAAITAAGTDPILILRSASPYNEALTPSGGQTLYGQGTSTNVTATVNGSSVTLLPGLGIGSPSVDSLTSGTALTLPGTGTVTLRGLRLVSASGKGIYGSSFGTLSATDASLKAAGGRALDLTTGTVSATLRSVDANGGDYGIYLSGASGTLTVTGDGATAASGGTIQNSTVNGVYVVGGGTVALSYVRLQTIANDGVLAGGGSGTTTLTLSNSSIQSYGTATGAWFGVNLWPTGGTVRATVSGNSIGSSANGSGVQLYAQYGKVVALISGNTINNVGGDGIQAPAGSSGNIQATVSNNRITLWSNSSTGGYYGGVGVQADAQVCLALSGNDISAPAQDPYGYLTFARIGLWAYGGAFTYKHAGTGTTSAADVNADNPLVGTSYISIDTSMGSLNNNNNTACEQP